MVLDGTIVNGQIVLHQPQPLLPEGAQVKVEVIAEPTLAFLLKYAGKATGLPADPAENHDHYLHGTPKTCDHHFEQAGFVALLK